jgi:hypothetical protein
VVLKYNLFLEWKNKNCKYLKTGCSGKYLDLSGMGSLGYYITRNYTIYRPWSNIVKIIKSWRLYLSGYVAWMGKKNAFRILEGKSLGKQPPEKYRKRWEDNTKTDFWEI